MPALARTRIRSAPFRCTLAITLFSLTGIMLATLTGCFTGTGPDDGGSTGGELSGNIVNITSNLHFSGDQPVTVLYNASTNATAASGFYVAVSGTGSDAEIVGSPVTFASSLAKGQGLSVVFNTGGIPLGIYKVGLTLVNSTGTLTVYSLGTVQVTTLPAPGFSQPAEDLYITPGTFVDVRANLGDPENAVQWRLFYIDEATATEGVPTGQLGSQIAVGTANQAIVSWNSTGAPLGTYRLGISVTDSGQSVADTSAAGQEDRIVTEYNDPFRVEVTSTLPTSRPPSVTVTQPASNVTKYGGDTVLVQFAVTVYEGPAGLQSLDVFYDRDGRAGTGDEEIFSEDLPITTRSAVFSTALIEAGQTVYLGVTADDGKNAPVTRYAPGRVTYGTTSNAQVTVTEPSSSLPKKPGETIQVAWSTTLSSSTNATLEVFRRRTDSSGTPTGAEISIKAATPLNQAGSIASFVADTPGRYQISVRVTLASDPDNPIVVNAPKLLTITTLPGMLWLGELARELDTDEELAFDGAIWGGVQFEDNAASCFEGNEDFDGDGISEFLITSRYAKPDFYNPTGIGLGEVYVVRGQRGERYLGRFNLNTVATSAAPGLVLTGIRPPETSVPDTDGIAHIFISKDADGDGVGEIVVGFPRVASTWSVTTPLTEQSSWSCGINYLRDSDGARVPQFYRGGAVAVSSLNDVLAQKTRDGIGVRIALDRVGQVFESRLSFEFFYQQVSPEPGEGNICPFDDESSWTRDYQVWDEEAPCPPDAACTDTNPCLVGCVYDLTGDGDRETIVQPEFGFDPRLADPWGCLFLYSTLADEDCGLEEGCPASDPDDPEHVAWPEFTCSALPCCDEDQLDPVGDFCASMRAMTGALGECDDEKALAKRELPVGLPLLLTYETGYYRERISGESETDANYNDILEVDPLTDYDPELNRGLIGARFIGRRINDGAGMFIAQSDNDLLITGPFNSIYDPYGLIADTNTNGGTSYMVRFNPIEGQGGRRLPRYYQPATDFSPANYLDITPVQPHQYLVGGYSHAGMPPGSHAGLHYDTDFIPAAIRILGDEEEMIQNVVGVPDFNEDRRTDMAVGAPLADVNRDGHPDGAVYIVYRRAPSLEGNYRLRNLKLPTNNVERLSGVLVREAYGEGQRFGESVAGDFDFNTDGVADIVVGNPDGNKLAGATRGTGEVVIIFGDSNLISQSGGIPVDDEGSTPGLLTRRQGARIRGIDTNSDFGFNVANVGDLDGDGLNDLAIAAPNASPKRDADPFDDVDRLDSAGLDVDLDGEMDDVSGPKGIADGRLDEDDHLIHAGLVYVILSSSITQDFASTNGGIMDISVSELGGEKLDGFIVIGWHGERYARATSGVISRPLNITWEGDFLGGGDAGSEIASGLDCNNAAPAAGSVDYGGNCYKKPVTFAADAGPATLTRQRGRGFGLGRAGDVDGDGFEDLLIGAQLADPRIDPITGEGTRNGGEAYLLYGFAR